MMRAFYGIALGSLLLLTGSIVASAQGGSAQSNGFTNLQVWPVDTPRAVVLNFMNAFNRSLGVECNYCHVQPDGTFDFASDEKREKRRNNGTGTTHVSSPQSSWRSNSL